MELLVAHAVVLMVVPLVVVPPVAQLAHLVVPRVQEVLLAARAAHPAALEAEAPGHPPSSIAAWRAGSPVASQAAWVVAPVVVAPAVVVLAVVRQADRVGQARLGAAAAGAHHHRRNSIAAWRAGSPVASQAAWVAVGEAQAVHAMEGRQVGHEVVVGHVEKTPGLWVDLRVASWAASWGASWGASWPAAHVVGLVVARVVVHVVVQAQQAVAVGPRHPRNWIVVWTVGSPGASRAASAAVEDHAVGHAVGHAVEHAVEHVEVHVGVHVGVAAHAVAHAVLRGQRGEEAAPQSHGAQRVTQSWVGEVAHVGVVRVEVVAPFQQEGAGGVGEQPWLCQVQPGLSASLGLSTSQVAQLRCCGLLLLGLCHATGLHNFQAPIWVRTTTGAGPVGHTHFPTRVGCRKMSTAHNRSRPHQKQCIKETKQQNIGQQQNRNGYR